MFNIFFKSKNKFEDELPDEEVILVVRKHWLFLAGPVSVLALLVFLPFLAFALLGLWSGFEKFLNIFWFVVSVYYLFLWNFAFYNIMLYLLNTVIITNKRIIENKQAGFYKHIVNELPLSRIQDISININGVLANFLDFGNLEIQTAGTETKFCFTFIPHPKKIKSAIPIKH